MAWKILSYHTVDRNLAASFAWQIEWFRRRGYVFTDFQTAWDQRRRPARRTITLTFDDGDWSVCGVALKVLADEGVQAMLYLTTDYVVQGSTYRAQVVRPSVTWRQLGSWVEAGHGLGSHTHTHADLTACEPDQVAAEIEGSRELIRRELGVTVAHFAYPWGRLNDTLLEWFRTQLTWLSAVAIKPETNRGSCDPYRLGRYAVTAVMGAPELRLIVLPRLCRFLYRRYLYLFPR